MKALLLVGDITYLPETLPLWRKQLADSDIDVYALGLGIRAVKQGDLPGLFTQTYRTEPLDPAHVMRQMLEIPNLVFADVVQVDISDQHVPWMHQYDLLQALYARVPRKYTHYLRGRFDLVFCEPLRTADDAVIVPTRYHHDLELLKQVVSDQFASVPATYADRFFAFADYYNGFKLEILARLADGTYNQCMPLIPEFKLKEYMDRANIPVHPQTLKAYPYSWLARLKHDPGNAYVRDLPPEVKL